MLPLFIFFALMAILCVTDLKMRHISNLIVIPAIIGAIIAFKTLLPALVMFAIMALLYSKNIWAGGDVKLATMVATFFGWKAFIIIAFTFGFIWLYRKLRDNYWPLPVSPFVIAASLTFIIADYLVGQFRP